MAASAENFDIRVLRTGVPRRYQLIIQYPGVQPESGHVIECELPPSYADLLVAAPPDRQRRWRKSTADLLNEENLVCYAADIEALKEIGDRLFQTVLQGELAGEYGVVADRVAREGGLLRLRINLTKVPELSREPWEALYRKRNEVLLAIHGATPVVRLLDSPTTPDVSPIEPPVRLLVVTAVPGHDLDVARELSNIERRTDKLLEVQRAVPFKVNVLSGATRSAMHEAVRDFEPHILHYIGHGSFEHGSGWIHLHSKSDPAEIDHVDAETLRDMLANARPKLVVLNTCEGGMASEIDSFSGMAHALIQRNIPYVIAMQYPISDDAAIAFSDMLYADLARGRPIDVAVTSARNAIRLLEDPALQVELITPVLYTSGSIERLIEPAAAEAAPTAAPAPAGDAEPPSASSTRPRKVMWIAGGAAALLLALGAGTIFLGSQIGGSMDQASAPVAGERPFDEASENAADDLLSEYDAENAMAEMSSGAADDEEARRPDEVGERDMGSSGRASPPTFEVAPRRAARARPHAAPRSSPDRAPAAVIEPETQPLPPPPPSPPPPPPPATQTCPDGTVVMATDVCAAPPPPPPPASEQPDRIGPRPGVEYASPSPGRLGGLLGAILPGVSMIVRTPGGTGPVPPGATWVDRDKDGRIDGYVLNGEFYPSVSGPPDRLGERDDSTGAGSGAVTTIEAEFADEAVARILGSQTFETAVSDPQVLVSIVGRGGPAWQQRLEFAQSIASKLAPDLPPARMLVDAVADHRDSAEVIEADLSYRVNGAARLHFALSSHSVTAEGTARLRVLANWLARNPDVSVFLQAHTDSSGPADYNLKLAERRADAVVNILISIGVASDQIEVEVVGEGMPAPGVRSRAADDRRVELMIVPAPLRGD